MKILVTGASGFTGAPFVRTAAAAGHHVVPLQSDLLDREGIAREVLAAEPDAVVHLAAISFVGHATPDAFYAVNVVGTTNLLDAVANLPRVPQRVLIASSANIYGNSAHSPLTEDHAPAPVNHYAASKLAMEHMARTYDHRLHLVIARPFNYTGPGQNVSFVVPKLAWHFATRAPRIELGNLDVEREFNDVQMVCDAYLHLLNYGESGATYNICSGQPYTLKHLIETLSRLTGHRPGIDVNPAFVRANEVHRLCGSPQRLNALLAKHGAKLSVPPLEDTLQRILRSYGQQEDTA
ncbi:NAD-dependent epimerase/dehydratase family protein [Variovorax sp. RKNM96]|uniref:NAD-dependent epimerase/dehydratase family protein n=1 Tax=Variovorax sp. RKNM96 TaxID=2681552 RepID=UPI00197F6FAA|nr:GDP-mannose 4,6-dehydratase [Variovorax sp. RKNM96]QSI28760.1 NAD-dependent epimerase/dehydratase family protein [Variovorax sp. RKNM96]